MWQLVKLNIILMFYWLDLVQGLRCMRCYGLGNNGCNKRGYIEECKSNQVSCETVVRRYDQHSLVMKACKERMACKNNQIQNRRYSGKSTQCNFSQRNSVCVCCCDTDLCNIDFPSCDKDLQTRCNIPANPFPHGAVSCRDMYSEGAVCQYRCTAENYVIHPVESKNTVCLNNGTWDRQTPCCARPCPPFFLVDVVSLIHFSGENAKEMLQTVMKSFYNVVATAEDALKDSLIYYSGTPVESTAIRFNEYQANSTRFMELANKRVSVVNNGPENLGGAIQYALDKLLTAESGMRDNRVPKAILIHTNSNSDDDVRGPAKEARRRGYQIYVKAFRQENYTFDQQQLMDLTNDKNHVFNFYGISPEENNKGFKDMINHFCQNPCDHVLHEHP